MAISPSPNPSLTDAPTEPDRADRTTFSPRATAWASWLKITNIPELRSMLTWIYNTAVQIYSNAGFAETAAITASSANTALGTSTTTYTPALTGVAASFVYVEAARTPTVGIRMRVVNGAAPATNYAEGVVTAWNSGTNTVSIIMDRIGSAPASASAWNLFTMGPPGLDGANAAVTSPTRTAAVSGSITAADSGYEVDVTVTGTTQTLDSPATLGDGFSCIVNAVGVPVTLSGSFNTGRTALVIPANFSALMTSNGTTHRVQLLPEVSSAFGAPGTATVLQSVAAAGVLSICAMTTTRGFTVEKSGAAAVVISLIDQTGAVLGTGTYSNGGATTVQHCQIIPIDASRALLAIAFTGGTADCSVMIVSFAGSVVTVGAPSALQTGGQFPSVAMLIGSTAKAVACWGVTTTGLRSAVVNIGAGTSITSVGATVTSFAGTNPQMTRVAAVSASQVVAMYLQSGATFPSAIPISESAGVLTPASAATNLDATMTNVNSFDVVTGNSTAVRAVAMQSNANGARAMTVDVTGAGASAKLFVGRSVPLATANTTGAYSTRLAKVSNDTYACLTAGADTSSTINVGVLTARDNGIELEAGAINVARAAAQLGLEGAVFGNSLLVGYADGDNSGFSSVKSVPLNSVV